MQFEGSFVAFRSSRECARQGFALGLTVLVSAFPCIKMDALFKLTVDLLEDQDKDCLFGCLFTSGDIAISGKLT